MVSRKNLDRRLASESIDLLFYLIVEKDGKRMLKPLKIDSKVPLKLIRAISDDTVTPDFYSKLSQDLRDRGVTPGSKVQLRAKFSPSHEMIDHVLKGIIVLCEVDV